MVCKRLIKPPLPVRSRLASVGYLILLSALSLWIPAPSPVFAGTEGEAEPESAVFSGLSGVEMMDGRLSIDVKDAELKAVLEAIGRVSAIPITLGGGITGRVTVKLTGVTPEIALRQLSRSHAVVFERSEDGTSYRIIRIGAFAEGTDSKDVSARPQTAGKDSDGMANCDPDASRSIDGGGTPQRAAKRTAGHLDRRGRPRFRPGELLIRIKPDLPGPQIAALHESLGARILSRMDRHRLQRLQLEEGADEDLAIKRYLDSGLVEVAERHVLMYPDTTLPDDPYFFQQWGLPVIQAPEAWDLDGSTSGPIIAVIDTGVDYLHPDLKENIWTNEAEVNGIEGVDDDNNGYIDDLGGWDFAGPSWFRQKDGDNDPMDTDGHGTHVAGIIAAKGNNNTGVAGVTWNARLMLLKAQADDAFELETWDVVEAVYYAIANGARIVNCSFGGDERSEILEDAYTELKKAGILAVCAAGNDGINMDTAGNQQYPAGFALDNILSVAASNRAEELADFSNFGSTSVDLVAPGVQIKSTILGGTFTEAFLTVETAAGKNNYDAIGMVFSGMTDQEGIAGVVYDCGRGYPDEFPPEVSGNMALIERGERGGEPPFYFYQKVANAQAASAAAVIIYNHQPGGFSGTLAGTGDWVPVVSISRQDGQTILGIIGQLPTVTLFNRANDVLLYYTEKSGTSMAAPFVAGVAGLMLAREPSLDYSTIKRAILETVDKLPAATGKMVSEGRLNAFSALSSLNTPGDVSCNDRIEIDDALLALQIATGMSPVIGSTCIPRSIDVNGDDRIGMEEAVFILQQIAAQP